MCRGSESNTRRQPLQGCALPLSYRGTTSLGLVTKLPPSLKLWKDAVASFATCPPKVFRRRKPEYTRAQREVTAAVFLGY